MTSSEARAPADAPVPVARVERERGFSWTWILPVAALALVVYSIVEANRARGPLIAVSVREGHGIQAGDPLRYRGVEVGAIEAVRLERDLSGVRLDVRLAPAAAALARAGTRFWLVRPQLSLEGVQGLETILGANYLAVLPGDVEGEMRREFIALEEPPVREAIEPGGLRILLDAPRRFGLAPGAPITFRDFQVGTVLSVRLASDATSVEVEAYIRPDYVGLVRANTRFWEVGGVEVDFSFTRGLRIDVGSLHSLLVGGIALATPDDPGPEARAGQRFRLEDDPGEDWHEWQPALPVRTSAAEGDPARPRPLHAELTWKADRLLARKHSRTGWLLAVPGGLIGPADLLRPQKGAHESTFLSVDGERHPLKEAPLVAGELARSSLSLPAVDPWPIERVEWGAQAGDWAAIAGGGAAPRPISAARLRVIDDGWELEGAPHFTAEWHGSAVIDRASGGLVGILIVGDERTRVLRPSASFW